ncbi:MAG: Smr/MutS family protein [Deltaproteobacteria bacterium]|nr:Smr/MutS family protein [Deltaproteobacteria bacterium]
MSDKHKAPKGSPFAALGALKKSMEAEEAAKKTAAAKKAEEARARGELAGPRRAKSTAPAPPAKGPSSPEVWRPDPVQDRHLFAMAMSGVAPLKSAPERLSAREGPARAPAAKAAPEARLKRAHAEGAEALTVTVTEDGAVEGVRPGHEFALLALGRFPSPEETLDLHGLDAVSARSRVQEFVRTRRARGLRCVCVVHGRGRRSPDGVPVLGDAVLEALRSPPACADLEAFRTAPEDLGGAGAMVLSLLP